MPTTVSVRRRSSAAIVENLDLIILFAVIVADIRLFKGGEVASYTLFEIFIWGYCAPVAFSLLVFARVRLDGAYGCFTRALIAYSTWLLAASAMGVLFRDTTILENTKSILPSLVMAVFLMLRVRDASAVRLCCNLYILYAIAACCIGFIQYRYGQPYFRDLVQGTEWKLDVEGHIIETPVVGFSGHPNEFAATILPGVALAVCKLIADIRQGHIRVVTVAVVLLLTSALALSQARGEMISVFAGVFFVTLCGHTRRFSLKLAYACGIIASLTVYGLHQAAMGAPEAQTLEVRYLLWITALHGLFSDAFMAIFGGGTTFMTQWSLSMAGWQFPDSHNTWVDQAIFFGFPGLLLYLWIWRQFFRTVEARPLPTCPEIVMFDSLRAAILAFMIDYFFEPYANDVLAESQVFFLMGLCLALTGAIAHPPLDHDLPGTV